MPAERRMYDRRRRVLYTTHQNASEESTSASRLATAKLREARRPAAAYGSHVNRRLRGRWFSLVPVKRRAMGIFSALTLGWAALLGLLHYLAFSWSPLMANQELARPFYLHQPDSFGRWTVCLMYALLAGTSLLVYQLRRYRNDDFLGHYRLWRLVLVVCVLASINTTVGLVGWLGAAIDAAFGKRVALSGGDWLSILLTFAAAIFALRLSMEVRRSRASLALMLLGWAWMAIPAAARWNFFSGESLAGAWLITSAPLMACACFWTSVTAYLRLLLRQVRNVEDEITPFGRLKQIAGRLRIVGEREELDSSEKPSSRSRSTDRRRAQRRDADESLTRPDDECDNPSQANPKAKSSETKKAARKSRRRWFGLRRSLNDSAKAKKAKTDAATKSRVEAKPNPEVSPPESNKVDPPKKKAKRGWFAFRLRPEVAGTTRANQDAEAARETRVTKSPKAMPSRIAKSNAPPSSEAWGEQPVTEPVAGESKGGGLRGWLGKRKTAAESKQPPEVDSPVRDREQTAKPSVTNSPEASPKDDESDIDWSSLSKAERRRLRKQMKRRDRAA